MTNEKAIEEINKEIRFAEMVIGVINNVKVPMLMYEEEKEVTKKALQKYLYELKSELNRKAVLDKIRAEIQSMDFDFGDFYDNTYAIREMVLEVIDKYRSEIEPQERSDKE